MMRHPMRSASRLAVAAFALAASVIAQAAPHWAYRPITRPTPPRSTWGTAPLDAFVFAAMQPHGLQPSPAAAPHEWLRRVTLDLTGLPPTPAELDAFLADSALGSALDSAADARERVVDRLLQSPAYAERWTAWWLDLARYADSQGYEKDALRPTMWRWRDWVLDAFARDLPFDQFTIEQLAGDLLPDATDEQRLATSFHRQTMCNTEGGTDNEEFRTAAVVDRVDTTMSVWNGSTLGCAQCHDHKYDPFTQKEFFQLFAFFDQTEDQDSDDDAPVLRMPTSAQRDAVAAIDRELTELRAGIDAVATEQAVDAWAAEQKRVLAAFEAAKAVSSPWQVLGPIEALDVNDAHKAVWAPERDGVHLDQEQDGQRWRAEPGYTDGVVHTWQGAKSAVYLHRTIRAEAAATALLSLGRDDAIKVWWNGTEVLAHMAPGAAAADQERLTVALQPGDNTLLLKISNGGGPGGFYFAMRAGPWDDATAKLVALPIFRTQEQQAALRRAFLAQAPELAARREALAALQAKRQELRGAAVPILRELPNDKRRTTRVHRRGSFLDQGDVVTADTPKVLPPFAADAPRDRLGFARWLMSPVHPLTARVLANRIWSELFGQGLVITLEDFGVQGERPSHPELLDWLASEFMARGWSLRQLLRTIVLSATYGQSAVQQAHAREVDPTNRWLARGPSVRLSAEVLRDQALAVSGLLSQKSGGPSVMPPQPEGIWLQPYSGDRWTEAKDDDRHRRALYTFWRRTSPHPAMLVFDMQSREACVLRRQRTNTPLQALVLWNEPCFRDAALTLGNRAVTESKAMDAVGMVRWLWRQCLLREPTTTEEQALTALYTAELQREWQAASAAPKANAAEAAQWANCVGMHAVAAAVLSLDEFVTKR